MSTAAKKAVVEQVRKGCAASEMIFFVDFKGVAVSAERSLRVDLRTKFASMRVAKARLIKIALRDLGAVGVHPVLEKMVGGQVALVFSEKDSQFVAKSLVNFQKKMGQSSFVTGGLYGNALYDSAGVLDLARVPSKQDAIQKLAFVLSAPLTCLARTIKEVAKKIE